MKTQKHYSEQETKELTEIGQLNPSKNRKKKLDEFSTKYNRTFGSVYVKMLTLGGKTRKHTKKVEKIGINNKSINTNIDISGKTISIPIKSIQIVNSNLIIKY